MKKLIVGVAIIAIGLFLLDRFLGQNPEQRNYQYFDDMSQSAAYKIQSANPYLRNGQTQQTPVRGAIPRGSAPLHYGNSEADLIRAGRELVNPTDVSATTARGQAVYQNQCRVCHGAGGEGDGPVVKRGFPPPPSLFAQQALDRTDGQIFYIITYGHKNMPSYASHVDVPDRWHVINYIRQLQMSHRNAQSTLGAPALEGEGE